jgi:hypothetical protein
MTPVLQCTRCHAQLEQAFMNRGGLSPCPVCGVPVEVEAFPAFYRPIARGSDGEPVMVEGEASCFYHPQKKAAVPCQGCGRFLCALCDCLLNGQHFCPACLETGKQKGKIKNLENQRTLYDSIALALAVYPAVLIFTLFFTIFTAPLALFIALRHWNAPRSLVHRSRARLVLAVIFSSLQIVGWGVYIYYMINAPKHNG